ncbi:N-acetylglucosamine-specific PTS transporter subunit IIBC [Brevibacillus humidisoli]|uniref:N-acetylglucosamine-specific PTS transporter subunit IIBC n=1 Tax=Brevibacillus humidisoli TaxID=2895522 RepID=UPI001E4B92B0|nr:N-acetylglucosamine-specific PTS transporter subunit IIBC [Brevibacillus humidisoli]UFJ40569.1 N-acetylglucosamine-specific PTS transporter subunit IIBC [Brevibacillus humidisoli]
MLAFLQKVGKSLMLPVATLPAAALLLRFGAISYENDFKLGAFGAFLDQYVAPFLLAGGDAIFANLSLIFAVGVAIGFAGDAVAALAAVIAYQVLVAVLGKVPAAMPFINDEVTLNMGVLGGILAGGIAAYMYKRYHDIKLPDWLGFFGGKRFVPIVTSLAMVVIALLFGLIWGPVQEALDAFGNWIVGLGAVGAGLFGFFNRLLIPFGLHHVLNAIAWFQIGSFTDAAGNVVHGDLHRFFAGDKTAGMFMTGFFPIMMFALPAAAFAIIHTAKPEKRLAISSVFIGTALASFLTGITEPIEFAFMFVAPLLFVVHAVLTGVSAFLVTMLGIKHGFGFSAGLIDYLLNMPLATNPWMIIPIGLAFAVVYYFLFRFLIVKLNLRTPGRDDDEADTAGDGAAGVTGLTEKAAKVLAAIGGKGNIKDVDACITRLRLVLHNDALVDEKTLKALGAAGVLKLGQGSVQVVFGTQSEMLKDEILKLM